MFSKSGRGLRFVIDCADPRPLLELARGTPPHGVRVRCRHALCARGDAVHRVLQAVICIPAHCDPGDVGAWLSSCFARSEAPWYIDGVPAAGCPSLTRTAPRVNEILLHFAL